MYRNFGSRGGGNPAYTGNVSGSNSETMGSTSTSTTQQEQVGVLRVKAERVLLISIQFYWDTRALVKLYVNFTDI